MQLAPLVADMESRATGQQQLRRESEGFDLYRDDSVGGPSATSSERGVAQSDLCVCKVCGEATEGRRGGSIHALMPKYLR